MISGLDFEDGVLSFQPSHISSSLALLHCHSLLLFPSIWHLFIVLQQCCTVILFFYFLPSGICSSCYSIAALSLSSFIPCHLTFVHRATVQQCCTVILFFDSLPSSILSSCYSIATLSFWFLFPSIWHLFIVLEHCCTIILFFDSFHLESVHRATSLQYCHSLLVFPAIWHLFRELQHCCTVIIFFCPWHLVSVHRCTALPHYHSLLLFPVIWHPFCIVILFFCSPSSGICSYSIAAFSFSSFLLLLSTALYSVYLHGTKISSCLLN